MESPETHRILVVDDNLAIHEDFRKILERPVLADTAALDALETELFDAPSLETAGPTPTYTLSSAHQGQDALAMVTEACAQGRAYSLAFVDMRMPPGWDGVQTIIKLWAVDPELQVVICTAYSDYSWEQILFRLGVSDRLLLLKKPFETAEVCQLACALTQKWKLARHAHLKLAQLRSMVDEQTRDLAEANRRLTESENRYALAAAGANDGLWDWDIAADRVFYSRRWQSMIGHPETDASGTSEDWLGRIHPDDRRTVEHAFTAPADRGEGAQISVEYRILHVDGQYRWVLCRGLVVCDAQGTRLRAAGSQTDITDRKMAEAQLRHDALHDELTGLGNRAFVTRRLGECLARKARDTEVRFAVMIIDLDRFKVINDSLGHLVGDGLLVAMAKRMAARLGAPAGEEGGSRLDLARIGGDEFVLVLDGMREDCEILAVAARLIACAEEAFAIDEHEVHVSLRRRP